MKLSALLKDLVPEEVSLPEMDIAGLSLSSQQILPDYAFIATGTATQYIPQALDRGATTILYEKGAPLEYPSSSVPMVSIEGLSQHIATLTDRFYGPFPTLSTTGVTGTNGKTTVTYLLAQCLSQLGSSCGLIGTLGSGFVDKLDFNGLTTPDTVGLHRCFAKLKSQNAQVIAMEVSSHGLAQERVKHIPFESALFTNLTQDHLDYHGDMVSYGNAKLRFFFYPSLKRAILNADDPFIPQILNILPPDFPVVLCSTQSQANLPRFDSKHTHILTVTVEEADLSSHGIRAKIKTPMGEGQLRSSLVGEFNLSNLLLVVAELLMRNYSLANVLTAVSVAKAAPGRMQSLKGKNTAQVIIDYAHTPDALTRALQAARLHCKGKLWCIFGCGGDRDPSKRALMGANAYQNADYIIITNDNPRTEDPLEIIKAILSGIENNNKNIKKNDLTNIKDNKTNNDEINFVKDHKTHNEEINIIIEPDRAAAIEKAIAHAKSEDIILIAGKGHEDYQIIGHTRHPFSDAACVKKLIGENIS